MPTVKAGGRTFKFPYTKTGETVAKRFAAKNNGTITYKKPKKRS